MRLAILTASLALSLNYGLFVHFTLSGCATSTRLLSTVAVRATGSEAQDFGDILRNITLRREFSEIFTDELVILISLGPVE